jgi:hypothetical protein
LTTGSFAQNRNLQPNRMLGFRQRHKAAALRADFYGTAVTAPFPRPCSIHTAPSTARPIRLEVTILRKVRCPQRNLLQYRFFHAPRGPRVTTHTGWLSFTPHPVSVRNICLKDATSTLMIMFKQASGCICATRKTTDSLIRSQKILQYIER